MEGVPDGPSPPITDIPMRRPVPALALLLALAAMPAVAPAQDGPPKREGDARVASSGADRQRALGLFRRGEAAREAKDLDAAIAAFDEAIAVDPTFAGSFNSRGLAWAEKRD